MSFFATELGGLLIIISVIIALIMTDYISDYIEETKYQALFNTTEQDLIKYCVLPDLKSAQL